MATLKDIAKLANVSTCTISRYLSSNIVVKKETEDKIKHAIKELGYVPNVVAKSLKHMETFNVAVILPKINNLYYSEMSSGISQVLGQHHYNLYIYEVDNLNLNELKIIQSMRENMIAGIVFIGLFSDASFKDSIQTVMHWNIPVVYANRYIPYNGFPLLYPDLTKASKLGAEHLLQRGKHKIAYVHKQLPDNLLGHFIEGFKQASQSEDKPFMIEIKESMDLSKDCIPHLLQNDIDGLFVLNEMSAVHLTKALAEANIRIPTDMAVMSLGNSLMSQISTPELTCVDLQNRELGIKSAEIILSQIRKEAYPPVTVLEPFIVHRKST